MGGQPACFLSDSMVEKDSECVYTHQASLLGGDVWASPWVGDRAWGPRACVHACVRHACHHDRDFTVAWNPEERCAGMFVHL